MPGKKEKVEEAAEKTGEAVGKGLKEGARIAKRAGHGLKKELKKKDQMKRTGCSFFAKKNYVEQVTERVRFKAKNKVAL